MNEKKLFYALSDIDDDLIEGASRPPKRNPLLIYLPTAAAACLCIVIGLFAFLRTPQNSTDIIAARYGNGATEAHYSISVNPPENVPIEAIGVEPTSAPAVESAHLFSQSELPGDFSFRLNWDGKVYSMEDRLYTPFGTAGRSLTLTEEEVKTAWCLIEEATKESFAKGASFILHYTANGESYHLDFPADCIPMQKLGALLEEAADRIR